MTTVHLTETELQQYASEQDAVKEEQKAHVLDCALCQTKISNYALLFKSIHDTVKPKFDFDLSVLVMEQLPPPRSGFSSEKPIKHAVMIILGIAWLTVTYRIAPRLAVVFTTIPTMLIYFIITCTGSILAFICTSMYSEHKRKIKILNLDYPLQQ